MIHVAIAGGAGYTAGELLRLLIHHPHVQLAAIQSTSQAGKPVTSVHTDLVGELDAHCFVPSLKPEDADLFVLCMGHGQSREYMQNNPWLKQKQVIDLSQDHRFADTAEGFVYGLPELQRETLTQAQHVANPGCFATAMQLAILPLAQAGALTHDIHISGLTGSTGAGQQPTQTTHFSWRAENVSHYKLFAHQHLAEVAQLQQMVQPQHPPRKAYFVPYRGNFTRGILLTAYTPTALSAPALLELYQNYYADHPFTHVTTAPLALKQVVNTQKCLIQVQQLEGQAVLTVAIDNLLKGASGQAVQNLNLMCGFPETAGLLLKPSAF